MKEKKKTSKTTKIIVSSISILVIVPLLVGGYFLMSLFWNNQNVSLDKIQAANNEIIVCDNKGDILQSTNSHIETLGEVSPYLIEAFITVEDQTFFEHNGLDYRRIVGAFLNNIKGNNTQGASTITQQLVKNTLLTSDKSFDRKFNEAQLAIKLEKIMSKEEILKNYLNILYFSSGEYGVKNASMRFFGKNIGDISLAESAMLAGIIKSPTKYNPINNFNNADKRKELVLKTMLKSNKITKDLYDKAINEDIVIQNAVTCNNIADNYRKNVIIEAENILNKSHKEMQISEYQIFTYYDSLQQELVKKTVDSKSLQTKNSFNNLPTSLGMIIDNQTNGISAFYPNKFINVFEFRRQLGSTIKPIAVYAPALELGKITLNTPILDEQTRFGNYNPQNYNNKYYGWTNISDSVANSLNIPAVKILSEIGIDSACEFLEKMNFKIDKNDKNLSLALGGTTYGNTFIELCNGYTTLANEGVFKGNSFVKQIADKHGKIIIDNKNREKKQIFSKETSYLMTNTLNKTAKVGTAKKLSDLDFDVASKTGTVSNVDKNYNNDIYNISYTIQNTILCWQGNTIGEEGKLNKSSTGGGLTTLMAKTILQDLYSSTKPSNFVQPENVKKMTFDKYSYQQKHKIVICSENSPLKYSFNGLFDVTKLTNEKDKSFEKLNIINLFFNESSNSLQIEFEPNPRLRYKIYRKKFLQDEELIYDIIEREGKIMLNNPIDTKMFSTTYTIVPYYIDDKNIEVFGYPTKYRTSGLKFSIEKKIKF